MKRLLSGNEAIARGAYEYGIKVAAGYPGTPSTEILENISKYKEIYSEWSPNEKVALEVAIGASFTGIRSMATMKHVGLNVAADPLMTSSYTGVKGGLIVVVADDPGMHSSQNEQDSRNYARFAKIPMFEPSDSQEAKEFMSYSLDISEMFDTPVLFRTTTRISHSKGIVDISERTFKDREPLYNKNPEKYLMVPSYARKRRLFVEERMKRLTDYSNSFIKNKVIYKEKNLGIITSGILYQYVMEVFEDASIFKLSMSYPFPDNQILDFANNVKHLMVIEELDRFITEHVKSLGINLIGLELVPNIDELNPDILESVKYKLKTNGKRLYPKTSNKYEIKYNKIPLPPRLPVLCPGCPHRGVFYLLKKFKPIIMGDIGCYSLGGFFPLDSMDAIICMGAGISSAMGISKSGIKRPVVGIVGDSTFFHSGITGILDIGYNRGNVTIIVLDNRITAMTGHQENPGTGRTLSGDDTYKASIEKFAIAAGINSIKVFDPYDLKETEKVIKEEIKNDKASLIISRRPCVLILKKEGIKPYKVVADKCKSCGICIELGCPAIEKREKEDNNWIAYINKSLCTGCSVCEQVCKLNAIVEVTE